MTGIKKLLTFAGVALVAGFIFVWFGVFNIAANNKHWDITTYFLALVRDRSIAMRAAEMSVPDLKDKERIERGVANYSAMCAQCHLEPGMETSELYEGLYPKPPVLYKDRNFAKAPHETFWVIKNGIKMTAMPSWGIYNSDEQIWDMIATVMAMDNMAPEQYQKLKESGKHAHKGGGHGDADMQAADHHKESSGKKPEKKQAAGHHDDGSSH